MTWKSIDEFPGYSVSDDGRVRNDDTGRVLVLTRNQHHLLQVGMMRDGLQHKRSVTLLVAKAFLEPPALETFDTPINLDGDRANNHVDNLMWRPRWFAVKYHQQFDGREPKFNEPIQEIQTGYRYRDSLVAASTFGLLDQEIYTATLNRTYVWPTYQRFRVVAH